MPVIEDHRVSALHRAILVVVVVAVVLLVGSGDTEACTEETEECPVELTEADDATHGPHHRIDFGLERFGGAERSIMTLALGYTWAPGMQHSLHVNANLLDSSLGESDGDGLSDTLIQYSWAPTEKITARPWLPRRFGTGLGLVVPTGDLEKGTGSDMWVAAPFLGLPITIGESLILLPSLMYLHSFSHGENAIPLQALIGEFGVLYGFAQKWWVTFIPAAAQDFEFSETTLTASLQVGREIGSKHGISLEVGGSDDEITSFLIGFASDFNWRVALKGHLGFQ